MLRLGLGLDNRVFPGNLAVARTVPKSGCGRGDDIRLLGLDTDTQISWIWKQCGKILGNNPRHKGGLLNEGSKLSVAQQVLRRVVLHFPGTLRARGTDRLGVSGNVIVRRMRAPAGSPDESDCFEKQKM